MATRMEKQLKQANAAAIKLYRRVFEMNPFPNRDETLLHLHSAAVLLQVALVERLEATSHSTGWAEKPMNPNG